MKKSILFLLCLIAISKIKAMSHSTTRSMLKEDAIRVYANFFMDFLQSLSDENEQDIIKNMQNINPNELIKFKKGQELAWAIDSKKIIFESPTLDENIKKLYIRPTYFCLQSDKLNSLRCLLENGVVLHDVQSPQLHDVPYDKNIKFSVIEHISLLDRSEDYYQKVISLFIKHGKKINERDSQGKTALHRAANVSNANMIRALLRYNNIDINSRDLEGQTPLHRLIAHNPQKRNFSERISCLELLMGHEKIDANTGESSLDKSALILGIQAYSDLAKLLAWDPKVNPNRSNKESVTPLMYAIKNNDIEITSILIDRCANPYDEDCNCKNAFDYAKDKPEILELLKKHKNNFMLASDNA